MVASSISICGTRFTAVGIARIIEIIELGLRVKEKHNLSNMEIEVKAMARVFPKSSRPAHKPIASAYYSQEEENGEEVRPLYLGCDGDGNRDGEGELVVIDDISSLEEQKARKKQEYNEQLKHDVGLFRTLVAEYDRRVNESMLEIERLEVIYALSRIDRILAKYENEKERKEGRWLYYRRIPARYWHEMYRAYRLFMDLPESKMPFFTKDERIKMYWYIRLLPAVAKFDKVLSAGGLKFNVVKRFYYDHLSRS